jgi:hypothetical protein
LRSKNRTGRQTQHSAQATHEDNVHFAACLLWTKEQGLSIVFALRLALFPQVTRSCFTLLKQG